MKIVGFPKNGGNSQFAGYDKAKMPFDLRPIANYIGLWTLESLSGRAIDVPPPDQLDYAINPIPKFGARAVNVT